MQSGGKPRFKGAGSLWKTSWPKRVSLETMCCISNFSQGEVLFPRYYQSNVLQIKASSGFFLGATVGMSEAPAAPEIIATNQSAANEGWIFDVYAIDALTVRFRFTVYDGAGIAAQVETRDVSLVGVDPLGLLPQVFVNVLMAFAPPANRPPFGGIYITALGVQAVNFVDLTSAIVVGASNLIVGTGLNSSPLSEPNCLHGLVGGQAPWSAEFEVLSAYAAWNPLVQAALEIVEVQEPTPPIGVLNTNGWRANDPALPIGPAPDPWLPFVGGSSLALVTGGGLTPTVHCDSPVVFFPDNLSFPYSV